ncbi:hypothetical protein FB451DRAFT_1258530, partial [Mycena latifolia]
MRTTVSSLRAPRRLLPARPRPASAAQASSRMLKRLPQGRGPASSQSQRHCVLLVTFLRGVQSSSGELKPTLCCGTLHGHVESATDVRFNDPRRATQITHPTFTSHIMHLQYLHRARDGSSHFYCAIGNFLSNPLFFFISASQPCEPILLDKESKSLSGRVAQCCN